MVVKVEALPPQAVIVEVTFFAASLVLVGSGPAIPEAGLYLVTCVTVLKTDVESLGLGAAAAVAAKSAASKVVGRIVARQEC